MSNASYSRVRVVFFLSYLFFNDTATPEIYTLSLHDALPISRPAADAPPGVRIDYLTSTCASLGCVAPLKAHPSRSEEHTSELQSLRHLVCRLLLEKKKRKKKRYML